MFAPNLVPGLVQAFLGRAVGRQFAQRGTGLPVVMHLHGAIIGRMCLVGMNAVVMDEVELGDGCIVGALSFIRAGEKFEKRSLIVGNPARKIKEVSDEMLDWKTQGTRLYQSLPGEMHDHWQACAPLRELPPDRPAQESLYKTWNEIRGKH